MQQLFPHFPLSVIVQDLQSTASMEITIENILDGRLVLPPRFVSLDNSSEVTGIGTALTALHGISSIPVLPAMLLAQNISSGQLSPDHNTHRILQYSLPLVPAQPDHYQPNAIPPNNEATSSHNERFVFWIFLKISFNVKFNNDFFYVLVMNTCRFAVVFRNAPTNANESSKNERSNYCTAPGSDS